jgi:hypothetical protein
MIFLVLFLWLENLAGRNKNCPFHYINLKIEDTENFNTKPEHKFKRPMFSDYES